MTEKEIAERADSEMSDQALQEEEGRPEYASMAPQVVQEEDQSEPEESEQTNQPAEELDATEEEPEEASDFLLKWQERHEAYLAEKADQEAEPGRDLQAEKEASPKKGPFFKKKHRPKIDPLPIGKGELKEEPDQENQQATIPKELIWKTAPILSLALSVVLICLYFITPLGKLKQLIITGNAHVESSQIVQDSRIMREDYILSTLLNRKGHEKNIKHSSPWVKEANISFSFPNTFTITILEYSQIGFVNDGENYFSVLSSGEMAETATPQDQLPASYTTIHLSDRELIKKLVLQLATVNPSILAEIQDIHLTPSKATNDLLTLTMTSGHKVLVPLSDIDFKLPYYEKIGPKLTVASVIDMEVGIFSYALQ